MRRVSNFETFIKGRQQVNSNTVNEGVFSWIKDNVIDKLTGWTKSFYDKLTNGDIPKIPAGQPYAGKPSVMLYLPENGPINKQIEEVHGSGGHESDHSHEAIGEVYVLAVDPENRKPGLGRALSAWGLTYLRSLGLGQAMLYVDSSNERAITLYESMKFVHWDTDVMYRRPDQ